MSTAFYIVLDNQAPGFDPFVNGKALAAEAERLDAVCRKLGLRRREKAHTCFRNSGWKDLNCKEG